MAIYHRHKEKWDPKKIRSKVSKNRSYTINRKEVASSGVIDLQNTMWDHLSVDNEIILSGLEKSQNTDDQSERGFYGFRNHRITNINTSVTGIKIDGTRNYKGSYIPFTF